MILTLSEWKSKRNQGKHKFNATRCESNGIKFPSKLEKEYYERLVQAKKDGELFYFIQQVPIKLPGNTKYVVDFMIVYAIDNGMYHIEYVDVKGKMTPMSILKIKQVESLYPIRIKIIDSKYMKIHKI